MELLFKDIQDKRWLKRYCKFIEYFRKGKKENSQYHHILPQSLYPKFVKCEWNIVALSFREHYIAHFLLAKALGGKMWYAWNMMNNLSPKKINSRLYEKARGEFSKVLSKRMSEDNPMSRKSVKEKMIKSKTGKKLSLQTIERMRLAHSQRTNHYKHTDETKEKLRIARKKQKDPRKGTKHREESKELIRQSMIGRFKGEKHHKYKLSLLYDKFGRLIYIINESLTSFNKKVEEPILKINEQKTPYTTRFRKYKKYEGYFIIKPLDLRFSKGNFSYNILYKK